jgi:hypothetical protein
MSSPLSIVESQPLPSQQHDAGTGGLSIVDSKPLPSGGVLDKIGHAAGNWWEQANPIEQYKAVGDTLYHVMTHPGQTLSQIGAANDAPRVAAVDAFKRGDYTEGMRHGLNWLLNAIPGVGSTMEKASDQAQSGDLAGGIGTTLGVATNLLAPAVIPRVARAAASAIGDAAKTAATATLGATTGVGSTPLKAALEGDHPDLVPAMRGAISEPQVLQNFKDAVSDMKDQRSTEYQQALRSLPSSQVDISPIRSTLYDQLQKFGVKETSDGLDFSRSTIRDKAAQADVQSIHDDVTDWGSKPGDTTPAGVDILKRRIDDTYSPSATNRALVQAVKDSARQTLNDQVPGYQAMTQKYAQHSQFLDYLNDLSLDSANPGTATRKLTTALRQNNDFRASLVDQLGQYTGKDLTGQLAGLNLSQAAPQGIMRAISGGSAIGMVAGIASGIVHPATVASMLAASPRLMGEMLNVLGKIPPRSLSTLPASQLPMAAAGQVARGVSSPVAAMPTPAFPMAAQNDQNQMASR